MNQQEKPKRPEEDRLERNRFVDILQKLKEKNEGNFQFDDYTQIIENMEESDGERSKIPFPYGGTSDFGKWVTDT